MRIVLRAAAHLASRAARSREVYKLLDVIGYLLGSASHSFNFDHRRLPDTLRTAMATAFFWPTSTTSFLPLVTPV